MPPAYRQQVTLSMTSRRLQRPRLHTTTSRPNSKAKSEISKSSVPSSNARTSTSWKGLSGATPNASYCQPRIRKIQIGPWWIQVQNQRLLTPPRIPPPLTQSGARRAPARAYAITQPMGKSIPNRSAFDVVNRDEKHGNFGVTCQNAPVHCPIISARSLVDVGCFVTFKGRCSGCCCSSSSSSACSCGKGWHQDPEAWQT